MYAATGSAGGTETCPEATISLPYYTAWNNAYSFGTEDTCTATASGNSLLSDGDCDDGGIGSEYSHCGCGTDFSDCGARAAYVSCACCSSLAVTVRNGSRRGCSLPVRSCLRPYNRVEPAGCMAGLRRTIGPLWHVHTVEPRRLYRLHRRGPTSLPVRVVLSLVLHAARLALHVVRRSRERTQMPRTLTPLCLRSDMRDFPCMVVRACALRS
jgi:hypothetical protein